MQRGNRMQEVRDLSDVTIGLLAVPKEPWVPAWPDSFDRVPWRNLIIRFFFYYAYRLQFCGDRNLFAGSVRRLAVPRGMRRAAYVETVKDLVGGEIAYRAAGQAAIAGAACVAGALWPILAFGIALVLCGFTWSALLAGASGLLLGIGGAALVAEVLRSAYGHAVKKWVHRLSSILGLAIAAVVVATIVQDRSVTTARAVELVAGEVAMFPLQLSVGVSIGYFLYRRRHLRQHLDAYVTYQLVWLFHQADGHPNDWGTPPVTSHVAAALEDTAWTVQRHLKRHLGGSRSWREPEKLGYAIAEDLRAQKRGLTQRAGRTPYVRTIGQSVQHVVASGWGDLAGERQLIDPPAPSWQRRLRSTIAAMSVLLLGIGLQVSGLSIDGLPTRYVLTLGLLWLLAYVIPWLDPDFAERLRVVTDLRALTRPGAGGGKAEAPGRDRKHAA